MAGSIAGANDGTGNDAQFDNPTVLTLDPQGNLYVGDLNNSTVRYVDTQTNAVKTFAGVVDQAGVATGPLRDANGKLSATLNRAGGLLYVPGLGLLVTATFENSLLRIY